MMDEAGIKAMAMELAKDFKTPADLNLNRPLQAAIEQITSQP